METGGRDGGGVPCQEGKRALRRGFHHPPPPGARARIAFSVRISKAAPGLFRSGNLILRWVYFSTLENSQCRTRSRPHPACGPPPCFPGGERVGPRDHVLPRRRPAGHSPHRMAGGGAGGAPRGAIHAHSSDGLLALGHSWASAPPLGKQLWFKGKACHAQTAAQQAPMGSPARGQGAQKAPGQSVPGGTCPGNQAGASNPSLPSLT